MRKTILASLLIVSALSCASTPDGVSQVSPSVSVSPDPTSTRISPAPRVLFDDFNYAKAEEMEANGWILRTQSGWPGVPGATWGKERMSIHNDPAQSGNRLVRMTSSTDGTAAGTMQSQFCHERKYFEGTYAARVRFTDEPASGPDGDHIVETFYMISPLKAPMDLDYSELDFEYLPNGGWGRKENTMFATTWETFHPEPWKADNESENQTVSVAGWRTLVLQVSGDKVRYFVDGKLMADHGGRYYPEVPMSINFNLWFIRNGLLQVPEKRHWVEDIDWVFHEAVGVLTPAAVEERVADMRRRDVRFADTVPAIDPPLVSPCDF